MSKDNLLELVGKVVDVMPNSMFRVELDNGHILTAYINGKIRQNKIKIVTGDSVKLEVSVYDLNRGRITFRL